MMKTQESHTAKTKEAELLAVQEQLKLTDYEKIKKPGWIIAWNV